MDNLQSSYENKKLLAHRFAVRLKEQVEEILAEQKMSLAVPIEIRVKEWDSIKSKIDRKKLTLSDVSELEDFVGVRIILLFKRDAQRVCDLISSIFKVIRSEDTRHRLGVSQFGYQSTHFQVALPDEWLRIPTFRDFAGFSAEVQVRTAAQHIWAAASHVLQYKQEHAIPEPVLRSINRVSALLETVDLEFERALQERQEYRDELDVTDDATRLNVENLQAVLDSSLPMANRGDSEPYDELLDDLETVGIETIGQLRGLVRDHLDHALAEDKANVKAFRAKGATNTKGEITMAVDGGVWKSTSKRIGQGVFRTHVGLVRSMCGVVRKRKRA